MTCEKYHALCDLCWEALGLKESGGKHIAEHIRELRQERDFYMTQSNKHYQELLKLHDRSDDWVFWMGGDMSGNPPVQDGTYIEVIYRNGDRKHCQVGVSNECNDWRIGDKDGNYDPMDIIAYRVLLEAE